MFEALLITYICIREENCSLEFQGSLKLTLKFKVRSRSRGPVQKVSRVFKVEGNQKISRGKSSWSWKILNFKARTKAISSRPIIFKKMNGFESRQLQGYTFQWFCPLYCKSLKIKSDLINLGPRLHLNAHVS